jgi:Signal transduction histidine kinase
LDFRSVVFASSILLFVIGGVFCVYALAVRPRLREFSLWALAYCSLVIGAVLVIPRGLIHDFFSVVLADLFLIGFFGLLRAGLIVSWGERPRWSLLALGSAFILLWYSTFTFIWPSLPVRFYSYNGTIVLLCFWTMASVLRRPDRGTGSATRLVALGLGTIGALSFVRIVIAALDPLPKDIMVQAGWDAVIQAFLSAVCSALALTLILVHVEKLNARLAQAAGDRELLVREMAHRTKNDLALVDSLISLEEDAIASACIEGSVEEGAARLEALRDRIRCMAQAHERLSRSDQPGLVQLDSYLEAIAEGLPSRRGISIERSFASVALPFSFAVPLGLILNELATNSLKYAYPGAEEGRIVIAFDVAEMKEGKRRASLVVRDYGRGSAWPPEHPGLGTAIIESLAAKIGAGIAHDGVGGSSFTVSFDLPAEPES